MGSPAGKQCADEQICCFPLAIALCFTYNERNSDPNFGIVNTLTGRDLIPFDDKSL